MLINMSQLHTILPKYVNGNSSYSYLLDALSRNVFMSSALVVMLRAGCQLLVILKLKCSTVIKYTVNYDIDHDGHICQQEYLRYIDVPSSLGGEPTLAVCFQI